MTASCGTRLNINQTLCGPRASMFLDGGDILHPDMLLRAMKGIDQAFHLAALWLLQYQEYPRAAFEVNVVSL